MAYFDARENLYLPQFGDKFLQGMQAGQNFTKSKLQQALAIEDAKRQNALAQSNITQGDRQLSLQEAKQQMLGNKERSALQQLQEQNIAENIARRSFEIENAPEQLKQRLYNNFRNELKTSYGETDEGLLEDGLTPEYNADVSALLQGKIREALPLEKFAMPTEAKPMSSFGKIDYDVRQGLISPEDAALAKQKALNAGTMSMVTDPKTGGVSFSMGLGDNKRENLQSSTKNKLEEQQVNINKAYDRISSFYNSFNEEFLQLPQQLRYGTADFLNKLGAEFTPELKAKKDAYDKFRSRVTNNLSITLNELSGAAVSKEEAARISASLPTMDDSPSAFKSKMDAVMQNIRLSKMRYTYFSKQGINPLEANLPLADMPKLFKQQALTIEQEIRNAYPKDSEGNINKRVRERLNNLFGL